MQEQEIEAYVKELDKRLDTLTTNIAVLNASIERQGDVINELSKSFEKLTIVIEKTNENDKKIATLFEKCERINEKGTKNCPVSMSKISALEQKVEKLNNYIITALITFLMQFIGILVYLVDKHLK